jgi:hypothetical protein
MCAQRDQKGVPSRVEVRPPRELDRARFVELFCSEDFMIFSGRALTEEAAHGRFDHMLVMCEVRSVREAADR